MSFQQSAGLWNELYYGRYQSHSEQDRAPRDGYRALLIAILYRAICDYTQLFMEDVTGNGANASERRRSRHYLERDAESWLFDLERRPFSFIWVCEHLDFDATSLRNAIFKAKESRIELGPQMRRGRVKLH